MNKIILYSLLFLLISSSGNKEPFSEQNELLILYKEIYSENIQELKNRIHKYSKDIPIRKKIYLNRSIKISMYSKQLRQYIDTITSQKLKKSDKTGYLNNDEANEFKLKLKTFKDSLYSAYKPHSDEYLTRNISKLLSFAKMDSLDLFQQKKVSKSELSAVMNSIQLNVLILEFQFQLYLNYDLAGDNFECFFCKMGPEIIPKSKIINTNEFYEAKIYFGVSDSIFDPKNEIEGHNYEIRDGILNYQHKVKEPKGLVTKNGNFILKQPGTGKELLIPIKIDYEVLK